MKSNLKDFRVRPGEKVNLRECPTIAQPLFKSKKGYKNLLGEHIAQLSALQNLHYASNRFALLQTTSKREDELKSIRKQLENEK